jgi:acylphosphatase
MTAGASFGRKVPTCRLEAVYLSTQLFPQTMLVAGLFSFLLIILVQGQPEGWRMVDRFYGFRYEITGDNLFEKGFEQAARHEADVLGCFGWIQKSPRGSLVGEARCNKIQGPKFQEWLSHGPNGATGTKMDLKIYPDTKIRLHFSSFKVLEDSRDTCFLDQPHQCVEFNPPSSGKGHSEL